ncbi:MAG TPA: S9 family peptidase [Ramlibacter sp.]|jgi:dipeptidyl aminopeptidase/acylaminoacyl peptidase|uniref:S9 family peptidase n=1 Tax=Ramlibacter sp. TaxID=1917967 RepID=UPI002D6274B2|nr:S9 family peptidase [Ramlibacter sp.]HZY19336.1 S9 family peptidase [Ramlibacter sp.]
MRRPFEINDLDLHRKVSQLDCTAGVECAVGTVREVDRENDSHRSSVWLFPLDGGAPRRMTNGPWQESNARWAPAGRCIAFVSPRSGSMQAHLLPADGGEARACGELKGVSSLRWSPDGTSLLVTAAVPVDPDRKGGRGAPEPTEGPQVKVEVAWKLPYKTDGMGYMLGREVHLFRLDVATGEHRQLTDGNFDVFGFDASPDGQRIAFCRTREGRFAHRTDLWVCDADGSGARRLTESLATVLQPVWSPDGRWIAFAGAREEGDAQSSLYLLDARGGELRQLGDEDLEIADPGSLHWSADGARLVFTRARAGCHEVCSIGADGRGLEVLLGGERQLGAFATNGARLAFSIEHPSLPSEVWTADAQGRGERQVSRLNPWWDERVAVAAERRSFQVPDGRGGEETIHGWLIRAKGATGPGPLLDDAHGGPAAYALLDFDTNVFWQVLCSRGWSVLALNAVGSASQGREFCRRLTGRWGELDLPQHQAAIAQLQQDGVCDDRLAISGKSYGGFFSAWAVGHTAMFRAAVVMAPVGNLETHYGTSDGGYYADPFYLGSSPHFDRKKARELSPLQHIEKSTTPVLFMHGKEDERCPRCQSEEMFVSLMRAGDTPAELVVYPGADHHFLDQGAPTCRRDAARRIVAWVERWCGPDRAGKSVTGQPAAQEAM